MATPANGLDGGARSGQGTAAGGETGHPWPAADDSGEQAVDGAQQLIGKIRRILGAISVRPESFHQRQA
jgi:hypothetical protein